MDNPAIDGSIGGKYQTCSLVACGRVFLLEIAATPEQKKLGLGGRQGMPPGCGMLFPLDVLGKRCIWMKGMRFALDIIWLDGGGRIVHIESNVSPASYPRRFYPKTAALYIIELNAGVASEAGFVIGQKLELGL